MTNQRQSRPPISLDEAGGREEPKQGPLSYTGDVPKKKTRQGVNLAQVLMSGLVGLVLSLLAVTQILPSKADLASLGKKVEDVSGQVGKTDSTVGKDASRIDGINELLKTLASKNDLSPLAKKDDLSVFARKDDLGSLVRQVDLIPMARKDELARLASKDEIRILEERVRSSDGLPAKITGLETLVKGIETQIKAADEKVTSADSKVKVSIEDLGKKLSALEAFQNTLSTKITLLESTLKPSTTTITPTSGSVEAEVSIFGIPGAYGYLGMTYDLTRNTGLTLGQAGQGAVVGKIVKLKVTNKTGRDISSTNLVLNFIASGNIPKLYGTPDVVGSTYPWVLVSGGSSQSMLIFASGFGQFGAGMPLNRDETKTMFLNLRLAAENSIFTSNDQSWQVSFTPTVTVDSWDYK